MAELNFTPGGWFDSPEKLARCQADMDQEYGMPREPYTGNTGPLVNKIHHRMQERMNNEFGWHGTTPEQLRKRWDIT